MIIGEIFNPFENKNTISRCFKGGGKVKTPAPTPVPQEAEAAAAKRDVLDSNARKRGRTASQVINPGILLSMPALNKTGLKDTLG